MLGNVVVAGSKYFDTKKPDCEQSIVFIINT